MVELKQIWVFSIQDGFTGGIILANSEEEAFQRLAIDRNLDVSTMKSFADIYPLNALDLNKHIHDLW